jgi:predicted NBD/HSP70 family sugar kinase
VAERRRARSTPSLGIEIGPASVVAVLVDAGGTVVKRGQAAIRKDPASAARLAVKAADGASSGGVRSAVAALLPEDGGVASAMAALRKQGLDVGRPLASGTAAAIAEGWVGAAAGAANVVFFGCGDHTTAGVVVDGAPLIGARGRAASVAWLALNPVERDDYRRIGCLEAEVAAAGIVRRLIWRIKAGDRSSVQDAVKEDLGAISVDMVLDAARAGDGVSISVVRDTAKYLGMAAANLAAVMDPDALVLGGIMATSADLLLEPIRAEITRRLPKASADALTIVAAALGADAPAIGAARCASLGIK